MKNVLITGAKGQLGSSIQELVADSTNYKFVFADSKTLDITNENDVTAIFKEINFDYCINCAAYTAVDKAEEEIELCYKINAEAVQILAKACGENHCILIHVSTDFVFDGRKNEPYVEIDQTNPLNVYGASKLKGEEHVKEHLKEYFIIRTSWVYSKYRNNFVKTMLKLGNEREELNVISDQYGSPTYAMDLAKFIMTIVNEGLEDFGVYHFSNTGSISWFDFAKAIIKLSKSKAIVNPISSKEYVVKALRPQYSVMNTEKSQTLLGDPLTDWKFSLSKCIETMQE